MATATLERTLLSESPRLRLPQRRLKPEERELLIEQIDDLQFDTGALGVLTNVGDDELRALLAWETSTASFKPYEL